MSRACGRRGWVMAWVAAAAVMVAAPVRAELPAPASLRPQVEFWTKIFAVYSEHQIVMHDAEHLDRVYSVLDYRDQVARGADPVALAARQRHDVDREKRRIRALLTRLHQRQGNASGLGDEARTIRDLWATDKDRGRFARAAEQVRSQRGLAERFREGVRRSRLYLDAMERIFREEGLPVELTRLPLVESCFEFDAYSKVGAAGVWQFMPATARDYMSVGGVVDERRDPLRATRAAARHLKTNYRALGSWPLAITAYNHGLGGVQRAVRTIGTSDIGAIVRRYKGPRFGFASRNFYAEFLAALEVEREHEKYFGSLTFPGPAASDEVQLGSPVAVEVAARCAGVSTAALADLNPAIDRAVFTGNRNIPGSYLLRVPAGREAAFRRRLAAVAPAARMVAEERHRVRPGQTLSTIARHYGVSVRQIQHENGLRGTLIRAGQTLKIPPRGGAVTPARAVAHGTYRTHRTHRVAKGQTLSHIARRYRVSVSRLQRENRLRGTLIRAGQVLKIPAG